MKRFKNSLFKHPITAPLKIFIVFSMCIITMQHINASRLEENTLFSVTVIWKNTKVKYK